MTPLVRKLEKGVELACRDCGIGVRGKAPLVPMQSQGSERRMTDGDIWVQDAPWEISAVRCWQCHKRRSFAVQLVEDHPWVRKKVGSRGYVIAKIDASLSVLDALHMPLDRALKIASTDAGLLRMTELLPMSGSRCSWAARFVPVVVLGADARTCSVERWSHVSEEKLQACRDAFAELLAAQMDGLEVFACPDGTACMMCGVASVQAMRSTAYKAPVWVGPYSAETRALGGHFMPQPATGYLCRNCSNAVDEVGGAMGQRALEGAVRAHVGIAAAPNLEAELTGLQAWIALPPGTPPNTKPWSHVDLAEAADLLRSV